MRSANPHTGCPLTAPHPTHSTFICRTIMNSHAPRPTRVGLKMNPADIAIIDKHAADDEVSRASWVRRVIRRHLRELSATSQVTA